MLDVNSDPIHQTLSLYPDHRIEVCKGEIKFILYSGKIRTKNLFFQKVECKAANIYMELQEQKVTVF